MTYKFELNELGKQKMRWAAEESRKFHEWLYD